MVYRDQLFSSFAFVLNFILKLRTVAYWPWPSPSPLASQASLAFARVEQSLQGARGLEFVFI